MKCGALIVILLGAFRCGSWAADNEIDGEPAILVQAICSGVVHDRQTPFGHRAITVATNNVGRSEYPRYMFLPISTNEVVFRPLIVKFHWCGSQTFTRPDEPYFFPDRLYSLKIPKTALESGVIDICSARPGNATIQEIIPTPEEMEALTKKRQNRIQTCQRLVQQQHPESEALDKELALIQHLSAAASAAVVRVSQKMPLSDEAKVQREQTASELQGSR